MLTYNYNLFLLVFILTFYIHLIPGYSLLAKTYNCLEKVVTKKFDNFLIEFCAKF